MRCLLKKLRTDTRGQDLIEYALIAAFVAIAVLSLVPSVAEAIRSAYVHVGDTPMVRIIAAVVAVVILGVIVLRRVKQTDQ